MMAPDSDGRVQGNQCISLNSGYRKGLTVTDLLPRISSTAVQLDESTLIDICDLLGADTVAVDGRRVTFDKLLPTSDRQRWTGVFGEWVIADGPAWCVVPDAGTSDAWVRTA